MISLTDICTNDLDVTYALGINVSVLLNQKKLDYRPF